MRDWLTYERVAAVPEASTARVDYGNPPELFYFLSIIGQRQP